MSVKIPELVNPESLSESILLEILKNRCIEVPNVKNLKKSDLVEMFKRIALPLPQRRYNESKHLGKRLNELRVNRKIPVAIEDEQALYKSVISSQSNSPEKCDSSDRRSLSCENTKDSPSKRICLSNSSTGMNGVPVNGLKRKTNATNVSAQKEGQKRQKITWP